MKLLCDEQILLHFDYRVEETIFWVARNFKQLPEIGAGICHAYGVKMLSCFSLFWLIPCLRFGDLESGFTFIIESILFLSLGNEKQTVPIVLSWQYE